MKFRKKYSVKYRRATVYLDFNPRTGICSCCNKEFKTQLHHWIYEFETKEVRKKPELVLKNTSELCYYCHRLANSYKHILEQPERIQILSRSVPGDMLVNFEKGTKKEWGRLNKPIKIKK